MARSYQVSFNINGNLDASLLAALRNASAAMKGLGNSARVASAAAKASQAGLQGMANTLNNLGSLSQKFRELKKGLVDTKNSLSAAQNDANSLAAKFNRDKAAAEELRQQLERLQAAKRKAAADDAQFRLSANNLRGQREALIAQARALGATKNLKIPRELLGTNKGRELSALLTQITAVQNQLKSARESYKASSAELRNLRTAISDVNKQYREASKSARESENAFERAKSNAGQLKSRYQEQLAALQQVRSALSSAGFSTGNFAANEARLAAEIARVNAALERQRALAQAQQQSAQASQEMFNAYNNFQSALNTAEQIASPFKSAIQNAMTFEHAMSRVKALTQSQNIREGNTAVVESEMKALTDQARELGATTAFTATQAAQAMSYLGMAGWKTQQILGTMPGMLDLAAAAGADLAQTADIVSDNMTAMGVPVSQASHFMDVYSYALTNSNARLADFGETMKYAAPVAKAYGASLDETAAMVMMMANAGIKGSMAGTSLRMGLLRLAGPPKTATKEMAKLGLSLSDAQAGAEEAAAVIQGLGIDLTGATTSSEKMTRVLMQLHEKTKDLSQDEKLAAFKGIFGVNAETGWLALFDQGPEVFMEYLNGLKTADGYSKQVAATMLDDTQGALTILSSAWDAFSERIGEALTPAVRAVAEAFTPMVAAATSWIEKHPAIVQAAAAIAAALAAIVVGAAAVKLAFAGWNFIVSSITLVQTALATLADGALLGGLIGRLAAVRTALFGLGGAATLGGWSAMFAAISTQATAAAVAIRGFFASLSLGGIASGIVSTISSIGTAIMGAARAAFAFAFSPVGVALMALALAGMYCYQNWEKVAPVLSNIASIIGGALAGAIRTVVASFAAMSANGTFDALCASASQLASIVGGALVKAFAVFLTVAASAIAIVLQLIGDVIKTIAELGGGIADALGKASQGDISGAIDALGNTATKTLNNIKTLGSHVFDGVEQGAKNVQQTLDALNMPKMPTKAAVSRHAVKFDESGVAHSASVQTAAEVPQIDTTATQASLDAVGNAASNAATNMDGVNNAAQNISATGDALTQLTGQISPTADGLSQMTAAATANETALTANGTALAANGTALGANSSALQANIGSLQAFGAACDGAVSGVSALGSAASSAAGSVSGLGSAAQSACAQLAQAGANATASVNAAIASMPKGGAVAANYEGGIYRKGAFLTTFAERAPEAAIPLDNSARAKDLWTQAGQILGTLPKTQPINFEPTLETPPTVPEKMTGKKIPARRQSNQRARAQRQWPQLPKIFTQTQPTTTNIFGGMENGIFERLTKIFSGGGRGNIFGGDTGGLIQIQIPRENSGGMFGNLAGDIPSRQSEISTPTINLTVHVTINGPADEKIVQRGVEAALPAVDDWSKRYAEHLSEQRRRAFR